MKILKEGFVKNNEVKNFACSCQDCASDQCVNVEW